MKIAYFDCPSGISGDMVLGALIDLGLDTKTLKEGLGKLPLKGYTLKATRDSRHHITGTNLIIRMKETQLPRTYQDIKGMIKESGLSKRVKDLSLAIFGKLANAEAHIHGCKVTDVHFHEVGAVDSIIDIVGTAIGMERLGIERVYASSLPLGRGWVEISQGRMPVPAPATMELLKGIPVEPSPVRDELVTPTGAAIITTIAEGFGAIPSMKIEKVGYGIGDKDFKETPNLLRVIVGECDEPDMERLIVLETNIDDMNPQVYEYLMETLFDAGALDVFLVPIQMKKGRPAILLKVLCNEGKRGILMDIIFKESTSIGVRCYPVTRFCLEREIREASTPYGRVRVKVSKKDGRVLNIQPEYEDCKRIAKEKGVPLKDVISVAQKMLS